MHIKLTRVRYHTDSLIGGVLGRIHSSTGASRLNCQCPLCASRYVMKKGYLFHDVLILNTLLAELPISHSAH